MHHLFVSYSRRDAELVRPVVALLRSAGHSVWIDEADIPAAVPWLDEVVEAVESAQLVVVFETTSWHESIACGHELSVAEASGKRVVFVDPSSRPPTWIAQRVEEECRRLTAADQVRTEALTEARAWQNSGRKRYLLASRQRVTKFRLTVVGSATASAGAVPAYLVASRRRNRRKTVVAAALSVGTAITFGLARALPQILEKADATMQRDTDLVARSFVNDRLQQAEPFTLLDSLATNGTGDDATTITYESRMRLAELTSRPWPDTLERGVEASATASIAGASERGGAGAAGVATIVNGALQIAAPDGTLRRLRRFNGDVASFSWAPAGDLIAVGHADVVSVVNPETGLELQQLSAPIAHIERVLWSDDGTRISAFGDGTLVGWDVSDITSPLFDHHAWVLDGAPIGRGSDIAVVTRDGRLLVVSPDAGVRSSTEFPQGVPIRVAETPDRDAVAAILRDGTAGRVAMVGADGTIRWEVALPGCSTSDVAVGDGRVVVACTQSVVYLGLDGSDPRTVPLEMNPIAVARSGGTWLVRDQGGVIFDLGDDLSQQRGLDSSVCLASTAALAGGDGSPWLVHGSAGTAGTSCNTDLYDQGEYGIVAVPFPWVKKSRSQAVAISPDGSLAAWGFDDGTVSVWHLPDVYAARTSHAMPDEVRGLAFSADSRTLTAVSRDGHVTTVDVSAEDFTADLQQRAVAIVHRAESLGLYAPAPKPEPIPSASAG